MLVQVLLQPIYTGEQNFSEKIILLLQKKTKNKKPKQKQKQKKQKQNQKTKNQKNISDKMTMEIRNV